MLVAFAVLAIGLAFGFGANWIGIFIYVSVALAAILTPLTALVAVVANAALPPSHPSRPMSGLQTCPSSRS